jgi:hypothetical protein
MHISSEYLPLGDGAGQFNQSGSNRAPARSTQAAPRSSVGMHYMRIFRVHSLPICSALISW